MKPLKTRLSGQADTLQSKWVRGSGLCMALGRDGLKCSRVIQNAHLVRRSKVVYLKHSPLITVPLCSSHHFKYDNAPHFMHLFCDEFFPGRIRYLVELERWASEHKYCFTHTNVLRAYVDFYKAREDCWLEWHESGENYVDFLEALRKEVA